jgi:hypothetical protein
LTSSTTSSTGRSRTAVVVDDASFAPASVASSVAADAPF